MKDKWLLKVISIEFLAIIFLVLGCIGVINTHIAAKTDLVMALLLGLSLLVACVSYMCVVGLAISILNVVTSKKK